MDKLDAEIALLWRRWRPISVDKLNIEILQLSEKIKNIKNKKSGDVLILKKTLLTKLKQNEANQNNRLRPKSVFATRENRR